MSHPTIDALNPPTLAKDQNRLRFSDAGPDATVRAIARWTRVGKPPKDEGAGVLVIPMGKVR